MSSKASGELLLWSELVTERTAPLLFREQAPFKIHKWSWNNKNMVKDSNGA
jgi:hypothetical protein